MGSVEREQPFATLGDMSAGARDGAAVLAFGGTEARSPLLRDPPSAGAYSPVGGEGRIGPPIT